MNFDVSPKARSKDYLFEHYSLYRLSFKVGRGGRPASTYI